MKTNRCISNKIMKDSTNAAANITMSLANTICCFMLQQTKVQLIPNRLKK